MFVIVFFGIDWRPPYRFACDVAWQDGPVPHACKVKPLFGFLLQLTGIGNRYSIDEFVCLAGVVFVEVRFDVFAASIALCLVHGDDARVKEPLPGRNFVVLITSTRAFAVLYSPAFMSFAWALEAGS